MTEISGQYQFSKNSILVRETPKGIESGKFKGYSPSGEVMVETSDNPLSVWPEKDSKTVEQALNEKNKKLKILAQFASVQNKIIEKLGAESRCKAEEHCDKPSKSLNYRA